MKVGDLVTHYEDKALGLIVGQDPDHKYGFRFHVKWLDMAMIHEEAPEWLSLISTTYKKD